MSSLSKRKFSINNVKAFLTNWFMLPASIDKKIN